MTVERYLRLIAGNVDAPHIECHPDDGEQQEHAHRHRNENEAFLTIGTHH